MRLPVLRHMLMTMILLGMAASISYAADLTVKSGLDLDHGYDVNTVATRQGKIASTQFMTEKEFVIFEMTGGDETVRLCVGPASYWSKHGIVLHLNDDVIAKGSKAQGKDGKLYLLVRKLENRTTGAQLELRSERGEPVWHGARIGPMMNDRQSGGQRHQGNGMMRGGGMMRR